jgi:hypothetical protein
MSTPTVDAIVADYLYRLDLAAAQLGPDNRAELVTGIREHIAAARESGAATGEAEIRTMLERLGTPEEIVAAARAEEGTIAPSAAPARPSIALEIAAVLMLTVGSLIPVAGWLVGVVLLWTSKQWTRGEKLLGTLVLPGGVGAMLMLGGAASFMISQVCTTADGVETCTGFALPAWLGVPVLGLLLVAPIVVAGVLIARVQARRKAGVDLSTIR